MILAGDIGGTRTLLAAFNTEGSKLQRVVEKTYPSQEHGGLAEIVADFIKTEGIPVHSACFGVAGPVRAGRSKISNLPWTIDSRELATQLKLDSVGLINDLEAYAYGVDALESKDLVTLRAGLDDAEGNRAVIAARTGLGVAGLYWDGFRHHPFACEGGHTDFAPRNELEVELFRYILKKHGHVSSERILSGPGIKNIYDFLRDTKKAGEPAWLKEQMDKTHDAPALISQMAQEKKAPICEQTFSIFVSLYGAKTGDCALTFMSTGGIFICGIIAARNLARMQEPAFMEAFLSKGRMRGLLEEMPVKIVVNDDCGIMGAARYTLIQRAFGKPKSGAA
jgi:glucokinase